MDPLTIITYTLWTTTLYSSKKNFYNNKLTTLNSIYNNVHDSKRERMWSVLFLSKPKKNLTFLLQFVYFKSFYHAFEHALCHVLVRSNILLSLW